MKTKITLLMIALLLTGGACLAQQVLSLYARGFTHPIGVEVDVQGRLWVSEAGSGNNDGKVTVVTTDTMRHPFLTGLPSFTDTLSGETSGPSRTHLIGGELLLIQGEGHDTAYSGSLMRFDTTGWTPGQAAKSLNDVTHKVQVSKWALGKGFAESNPYSIARDAASGDLYIADAAANALLYWDASEDTLGVMAVFPDIPNPTPVGPPQINAVPTKVILDGNRLLVTSLSGFPFADMAAAVYEVDMQGNVTVLKDQLTTLVDIAIDPADGLPVLLQHMRFTVQGGPPRPLPMSGGVFKLKASGVVDTVVYGLNFPAAMDYDAQGNLFITSYMEGNVYRLGKYGVAIDPPLASTAFKLYPNPSAGLTHIEFELTRQSAVSLNIMDINGRLVRRLLDGPMPAGKHHVSWDGRYQADIPLMPGFYFCQLRVDKTYIWQKLLLTESMR